MAGHYDSISKASNMSALSNARWILLSQVARTVIQLSSLVVLSRLLNPTEYGLMAMVTVVVNFVYLLRDMGTAAAVVQKDDLSEDTTSTVFWLNVGTGMLLGVILVVLAPFIADAFRTPRLVPVLRVIALVFPLSSTSAVHQALLERANGFRTIARIEVVASLAGLAVALLLAWQGAGVYSLAFQTLCTIAMATLQLWLASKWRPTLRWSASEVRALWGFSSSFTGFTFINYFARNADAMVIGRVLGSVQLGVYAQGYRVMMFPLQSMSFVANRALFPVMSRQQGAPQQMAQLYLRALGLITTVTAPLMAGLWLLREPFVLVALGHQWGEVAGILAWLAPVGFVQSMISTTGTVFMSNGRTDILLRLGLLSTTLQVSAFFIGAQWGIVGVAMWYLVANVVNFFPAFYVTLRQMRSSPSDLLSAVGRPTAAALVMVAALWPLLRLLESHQTAAWTLLLTLAPLGALIFIGVMLLISPSTVRDFRRFAGNA
jgi:PST family polysaccharide transporter